MLRSPYGSPDPSVIMTDIVSPETLATQMEYYLTAVDLERCELEFARLDEAAYRQAAFMDRRVRSVAGESTRVALAVMEETARTLKAAPSCGTVNYILHSAFCCSTLLSRCLDIDGVCSALREPDVLMQMANYKRGNHPYSLDAARWQPLIDTVLFILAKSRRSGESRIIKPTNAANNLGVEMIGNPRTHGMLLLYSALEPFLVSIIKKGEEGRAYVRRLFNVIMMDSAHTEALSPRSLAELTDLQVAAFTWSLQMEQYLSLLGRFPDARLRTLDCEVFLDRPVGVLTKLCELFGIEVPVAVLEAMVAGPIFAKDSKHPSHDYDSAVRKAEYGQVIRDYHTELAGTLAWSAHIRPQGPIRLPLPQAL